ncbi:MAG: DUF3892 domain-containing protein [Rhabdochlamydiaceae bacterium]
MAEFRITCIVREHGIIAYVGINGNRYPVLTVANWILNTPDAFYTHEAGYTALVYARRNHWTGRWFLTTQPDGILEDNLGFLPECQ